MNYIQTHQSKQYKYIYMTIDQWKLKYKMLSYKSPVKYKFKNKLFEFIKFNNGLIIQTNDRNAIRFSEKSSQENILPIINYSICTNNLLGVTL